VEPNRAPSPATAAARPSIDLDGRVVLVTGGAGGLGVACARLAARAGARIALSDLPGERLDAACALLVDGGADAAALPADLADGAAGRELASATLDRFGRLDGLVACAGIMQTKPFADLSEAEWRRVLDINLTGTFLTVQAAGAAIGEEGGSIVLFSSVAARSGRPNAAHYAASKAAMLSLTKSAAMAYAPAVRVNALCPGVIMTDMWRGILRDRAEMTGEDRGDEYLEHLRTSAPLQRIGEPDEIAAAALFLLSDLSSFITGQALNVDGGLEMN
jgi:NAD(P)-dependent dehydrogenase (short-subunit alcohol dehydrogenase family)